MFFHFDPVISLRCLEAASRHGMIYALDGMMFAQWKASIYSSARRLSENWIHLEKKKNNWAAKVLE